MMTRGAMMVLIIMMMVNIDGDGVDHSNDFG